MHIADENVLIKIQNVKKYFGSKKKIVTALDGINLDIFRGENLAVVGETGSGKTTLGRISCRLEKQSYGTVDLDGKDINKFKKEEIWKRAQYIHQDPYSAVDPLLSVREILARPLKYVLGMANKEEMENISIDALAKTGLDSAYLDKKGADLSGGERQRVLIARAFIVKPEYVVVDEPTTMIDFIHRNEVIDTIRGIGETFNTTIFLITHDISIVPRLVKKVVVIYRGKIVEQGNVSQILKNPLHPYSAFLTSIDAKKLVKDTKLRSYLEGYGERSQSAGYSLNGCVYASSCPLADKRCRETSPGFTEVDSGHFVACFKPGEFHI